MPSYPISSDEISLWLSLAVIVFIEGLAIHTWQFRKEPGALWQVGLQADKGIGLLVLLLTNRSATIPQKEIFLQIGTVLSLLACYRWFRLAAPTLLAFNNLQGRLLLLRQ